MGRPREHDERTGLALLDAAERVVETDGLHTLSVRALASDVGCSTRAVYSLFGSKDGLVAALGERAFDVLAKAVLARPATNDAAADLVDAGVLGFRRFVLDHPGLFQVGIQHPHTTAEQLAVIRVAAARAWTVLRARVVRLEEQGGLGTRSVDEAAVAFHALCEGLAALELRGELPPKMAEAHWRRALADLVAGFGVSHS